MPGEDAVQIPLKRKFLSVKQTDKIAIYTVIDCLAPVTLIAISCLKNSKMIVTWHRKRHRYCPKSEKV